MAKQTNEHELEQANQAHKEKRVDDIFKKETEDPLGILSLLIREVDMLQKTMPQARKELGEWFNNHPDRALLKADGKTRMRRLKQITDAMYEEFTSLASQQQG
jgi:hypothetical protein